MMALWRAGRRPSNTGSAHCKINVITRWTTILIVQERTYLQQVFKIPCHKLPHGWGIPVEAPYRAVTKCGYRTIAIMYVLSDSNQIQKRKKNTTRLTFESHHLPQLEVLASSEWMWLSIHLAQTREGGWQQTLNESWTQITLASWKRHSKNNC